MLGVTPGGAKPGTFLALCFTTAGALVRLGGLAYHAEQGARVKQTCCTTRCTLRREYVPIHVRPGPGRVGHALPQVLNPSTALPAATVARTQPHTNVCHTSHNGLHPTLTHLADPEPPSPKPPPPRAGKSSARTRARPWRMATGWAARGAPRPPPPLLPPPGNAGNSAAVGAGRYSGPAAAAASRSMSRRAPVSSTILRPDAVYSTR